jgi:hypothetical protein
VIQLTGYDVFLLNICEVEPSSWHTSIDLTAAAAEVAVALGVPHIRLGALHLLADLVHLICLLQRPSPPASSACSNALSRNEIETDGAGRSAGMLTLAVLADLSDNVMVCE